LERDTFRAAKHPTASDLLHFAIEAIDFWPTQLHSFFGGIQVKHDAAIIHAEIHPPVIKLALCHLGAEIRKPTLGAYILRTVIPVSTMLDFFLAPHDFRVALLSSHRLAEFVDQSLSIRVLALFQIQGRARVA